MTHAPIRVGLLGCGGIARAHVNGYLAHSSEIEVVAVADLDEQARNSYASELGASAHATLQELLEQAEVDAIDICLPHHLHAAAILEAAAAGKHVLCEKPLCLSLEEGDQIQSAVTAAGITLMAAHNQLFFPSITAARQLLDEGLLGRLYEVRTVDCFRNEFDVETMGWRADRSASGGGELIDTGYHPTYLMLHLTGARPSAVSAMLSTHRLTFSEGEDSAQVLVRFDNGVLGHIRTSWAYASPADAERFAVIGENGTMWGTRTELRYELRSGASATLSFPAVDTFAAQIAHFAACLRTGSAPLHDERIGVEALRLILGAYEAASSGTVVTLAR